MAEQETLNLDKVDLWVIKGDNEDGIPAVMLDSSTGKYCILVFTSKRAAKQYIYHQDPTLESHIHELDRRSHKGQVIQAGLIRIARTAFMKYKHITQIIFDHPGRINVPSKFAEIEDIAGLARTKLTDQQAKNPNELFGFLDQGTKE